MPVKPSVMSISSTTQVLPEDADALYVKFSFNGWVVVHSFHLQR